MRIGLQVNNVVIHLKEQLKIKMKNKGFTLIELMMVISIISVLLSISLIKFSGYSKLENKMDVDLFNNSLLNFINNSKGYCRDNNIDGYILFDIERNTITFNSELERVNTLTIPYKFILNTEVSGNKIKIDNRGITANACTISYKDREGKIHSLTMCVGTAYVEIKS